MFNIFGMSVRYYSVLFFSGLLLSLYLLVKVYKTEGIPLRKLEILCYYLLAGIFIGARLGHCLFYEPAYYLEHPIEMVMPIKLVGDRYVFTGYRGIASHGAAIGIFVAIWVYSVRNRIKLLKVLDMVLIFAPLCGTFIRVGNLMNSEILGAPTTVPWAFVFEHVDSLPRHPAQLYEAIAYFATFTLAGYLYIKNREQLRTGYIAATVATLMFGARFVIEFFKENQGQFENMLVLNMGQILSIPIIVAGVWVLVKKNTGAGRITPS